MSRVDDPLSCFRCFDMKVVDPASLDSVKQLLIDIYQIDGQEIDTELRRADAELWERIHRHIILLESLPNE